MGIRIKKESDIHITEGDLKRYKDEYDKCMRFYAGPKITLEEFIRSRKKGKVNDLRKQN